MFAGAVRTVGLLLITATPCATPFTTPVEIMGYCEQPPTPAPMAAEVHTVWAAPGPEPGTVWDRAEPGSSISNRASETLPLIKRLVTLVPKLTEILAVG